MGACWSRSCSPRAWRRRRRHAGERDRLRAAALREGHLGVDGGHDGRGVGPADRPPGGGRDSRSVQTSTTNIGAYMWSAVGAEQSRDHRRTARRSGGSSRRIAHARGDGAPPGRGQFYNWYDHRTGEKLTVWPPQPATTRARARSCRRSTTAGSRSASRSSATASRGSPTARARSTTRCTGASTTARPQPDPTSTSSRDTGGLAVLLRHGRLREPDRRPTSASRSGEIAAEAVLRAATAPSRTRATGPGQETRPVGYTRTYYGRRRYEGALRVRGHAASTPSWGG